MKLQKTISGCLRGTVQRDELTKLINFCHTVALAYLRMKGSASQLYMFRGERLEDLGWDFIAELFEKDDQGQFVQLQQYFSQFDLDDLNESEVRIELRKLVFTKVDDSVFRALGKKDPSLRKIIRNLKLAIGDTDTRYRVSYENGMIIVGEDSNTHCPSIPSEFMQIRLCSRLNSNMQIPEVLYEVIEILAHQDMYRKQISLVKLSTIIRESFVHINEQQDKTKHESTDDQLIHTEFEKFLAKSVQKVKTTTGHSYINKGKITTSDLDLYIHAATDIVRDQLMGDTKKFSQYECLKKYMPTLEHSDYRNNKRQFLEYLVNLIKNDLLSTYKEDII